METHLIRHLVRRFNCPERPNLEHALSVVDGASHPEIAWERVCFARILVPSWHGRASREFAVIPDESKYVTRDEVETQEFPTSVADVISVAADYSSIYIAEVCAMSLAERLAPWRGKHTRRMVWHWFDEPPQRTVYMSPALDSARDTVDDSLEENGVDISSLQPTKEEADLPLLVRRTIAAARGWEMASENDWLLGGSRWPFNHKNKTRFRELENPFAPLLDLWKTGYLTVSRFTRESPEIKLYGKRVPANSITRKRQV